ncbi:M50 family metallopeptidase [Ancylomarina sp. DW003]|nr:site-2 protease family protein [Ancylomarina sp. DW003]MDE5422638.1 M50 family metallopeptidase [Ancylomarina sp. DW003]
MILVVISIYILVGLIPKWILKKDYETLCDNFSWKIPLFKLSGLLVSLSLAFILISIVTFSTKKQFIENKNAIYGLEFNTVMENLGFEDGMKIKSINDKAVNKISDIIPTIILEYDKSSVSIDKDGIESLITLDSKAKGQLLQSVNHDYIKPIMHEGDKYIKITTVNNDISDVFFRFKTLWNKAMNFINPSPKDVGGFMVFSAQTNVVGYAIYFSYTLILLGIVNLLPMPGFNIGNAIISTIEIKRRKYYNRKKKRIVGLISIVLVIIFLLSGL